MLGPIPDVWRNVVVAILRSGDDRLIEWTPRAFLRWKTDTSAAWKHEAYDAMIAALSQPVLEGAETTSFTGQTATYEFLFPFGPTLMYGKIALRSDKSRILILSAHRAERPFLRP